MVSTSCGSSPRMWGTRPTDGHLYLGARFIPTHVGNTPAHRFRTCASPVHPHACGEHHINAQCVVGKVGSSPRMWGTPGQQLQPGGPLRFIPTHVGNTLRRRYSGRRLPVHPHACGEHISASVTTAAVSGSSPRMWGTREMRCWPVLINRFIPTHVGNTYRSSRFFIGTTVHPHACGEHAIAVAFNEPNDGSSPRMWGTRGNHGAANVPVRFIPTHVGNTSGGGVLHMRASVHPHACGEHKDTRDTQTLDAGSSPRMWGTHQRGAEPVVPGRFIPTHVGNTRSSPRRPRR